MTGMREKPLQHIHCCCKDNFVMGFCCWPYLACEAAGGEEGKAWKEGRGHDEEVASSKENEFKTRVQNRYPIYERVKNTTLWGHTYL